MWTASFYASNLLAHCSLGINDLNGPVPWDIVRLPQLKDLDLASNMLTGTLSTTILSSHHSLSLQHLRLSQNNISGTIPAEWFAKNHQGSGQLSSIMLHQNRLTGTIPSEIGLVTLKVLSVNNNTLSGSIASEVFQPSLINLWLGTNPVSIFLWSSLLVCWFELTD